MNLSSSFLLQRMITTQQHPAAAKFQELCNAKKKIVNKNLRMNGQRATGNGLMDYVNSRRQKNCTVGCANFADSSLVIDDVMSPNRK